LVSFAPVFRPRATGFWTTRAPGLLDAPAWTLDACLYCLDGDDHKSWRLGIAEVPCWGSAIRGTRRMALCQWLAWEVVHWVGHCHASIAVRKRAPVVQGDASSPATSVNWIRHSVQGLVFSLQCVEVHSNGLVVPSTLKEQAALYILPVGYALSHHWLRRS
jgi:hypothetical protein